jgi:4-hydroxy-3-polyprenylbenzoate decarboxylase
LTQANAILGQGQLSLAKYLWIADGSDSTTPPAHELDKFFQHLLARVDWRRDLHFHTCTTIDTLDYSGSGLNQGSKLVVAASGKACRTLAGEIRELDLPEEWTEPRVAMPGVLIVQAAGHQGESSQRNWQRVCDRLPQDAWCDRFPLIVVVDDSLMAAANIENFVWITFTRSNPASDVYGIGATTLDKHFGCKGSLVIDARIKPHHAPPLISDPNTLAKVDARAARGGELARYL